jgi:hypothetical protein
VPSEQRALDWVAGHRAMPKRKKVEDLQPVPNALDYFVGGVPPLGYCQLEVEHLDALVGSSKEHELTNLNHTAEVCLVGHSAHFEAFCKAQFAALVNICPEILKNFVERRYDATRQRSGLLNCIWSTGTGATVRSRYPSISRTLIKPPRGQR